MTPSLGAAASVVNAAEELGAEAILVETNDLNDELMTEEQKFK